MSGPTELVDQAGNRTFRIVRRIGRGGFGSVFLATVRQPSGLEQQVALKVLHRELDDGSQAAERLLDKARMLTALRHPVILAAHDLVLLDGRVALVTEYVDGEDLERAVYHPDHPLGLGPLLDVVGQVAGALEAAWSSLQVVHRDLKPQNIRIGRHGNVKLLDFGIARSESLLRSAHTSSDALLGSIGYLAPERFERGRGHQPGVDVFSLGCVLFEGLARRRLFADLEFPELLGLTRGPEFDAFVADALRAVEPDGVRSLLTDALRLDPERRPSAGAIASRCEELLGACDEPRLVRTWCRQHPWDGPDAAPTRLVRVSAPPEPPPPAPPPAPEPPSPAAPPAPEPPSPPPRRGLPWVAVLGTLGGLGSAAGLAVVVVAGIAIALGTRSGPAEAPPIVPPIAPVRAAPAPPPTPEPADPAPIPKPAEPARPAAPRTVWVTVAGDPGRFVLDGADLGPTNQRYDLPPGRHECAIAIGARRWSAPCDLRDGGTVALPAPTGRVSSTDRVRLQGEDGAWRSPGEVPRGIYRVYADFGSGEQYAGSVEVAADATVEVDCNPIRATCGPAR